MLDMKETRTKLKKQVTESLSIKNACFFYEAYNKWFETETIKYITRNFIAIVNNNEYLALSFKSFKRVLSHSELKINSEC